MKYCQNRCWLSKESICNGNKVHSCKYLFHRFRVTECAPKKYKEFAIDVVHKDELNKREELMNSGNFKSGENYNKKLDLRRIKKIFWYN